MGYEIYAKAPTEVEENLTAKKEKVKARYMPSTDGEVKFFVFGDHAKAKELTLELCKSIIDAGYLSFEIYHSY